MNRIVFLMMCILLIFVSGSDKKLNKNELFEKYLNKLYQEFKSQDNGKKRMDEPGAAAFQNFLMTFDPATGTVPFERLFTAFENRENYAFYRNNEQLKWQEVPTDMGGRIRALCVDPNDVTGKKVWAGAVTGGLWYNNNIYDSNSEWQIVSDIWESLSVSAICFDPINPQNIFIGTGEAFTARYIYRESSGRGIGILKSTDAGKTWSKLASTKDFAYITDIVARVESGKTVLYAGVASGFYKEKNHISLPGDGLYRSIDQGASWTQVLPDISGYNESFAVSDIEISAGNRIFVGTMKNLNNRGGACILSSDSGFAGSWTLMDNYQKEIENSEKSIPGRVMLASAPSEKNTVYALIGSGIITPEGFNYSYCHHIIRSTDGGISWQKRNTPSVPNNGFATIAWHALAIEVDPNNANNVFIGGLDVHRSTNAGNSWKKLSDWALMYQNGGDNFVHADIHDFVFLANSSNQLIISSDGGVFLTTTANISNPVFYQRNHNLNCLQFYTCDINPVKNTDNYAGGLQDNGSLHFTGGRLKLENMINGGDGAYCFFDKDYPSMLITSIYYNRYQLTEDGMYYASAGIQSGTFISPADYFSKENLLVANAVSFNKDNPDQVMIVDASENPPVSQMVQINTGSSVIFSAVKFTPEATAQNPEFLIATQSGRLFRIKNINTNPLATDIGSKLFPSANISSIACGNTSDTIVVSFSNYGVSSLLLTFDKGKNWKEIESNLPDIPVRWVLLHPKNSLQALVATELGIWSCNNISDSNLKWTLQSTGIGNVRVDMLQVRESDNIVLAATHGRGLSTAFWPLAERPDNVFENNNEKIKVYPALTSGLINIQIPEAYQECKLEIFNQMGNCILQNENLSSQAIYSFNLSIYSNGNYYIRIKSGEKVSVQKIVLMH